MLLKPRKETYAFRNFGRVLAVFATSIVSLSALEPGHSITQYGHTAWTRQEGRVPGAVFSLAQTRDGKLWVGTEFGLFHFDGVAFFPLQPTTGERLPSQAIAALEPAQDGSLWIGTQSVASRWNGETLLHYPLSNAARKLPVPAIRVDHDGSVWIGRDLD